MRIETEFEQISDGEMSDRARLFAEGATMAIEQLVPMFLKDLNRIGAALNGDLCGVLVEVYAVWAAGALAVQIAPSEREDN